MCRHSLLQFHCLLSALFHKDGCLDELALHWSDGCHVLCLALFAGASLLVFLLASVFPYRLSP